MAEAIYLNEGRSAYEMWLDQGNTGTEADFLEAQRGNSGYTGAAGELEVVNNLTQGGAAAALSAEMGKQLQQNKADKDLGNLRLLDRPSLTLRPERAAPIPISWPVTSCR